MINGNSKKGPKKEKKRKKKKNGGKSKKRSKRHCRGTSRHAVATPNADHSESIHHSFRNETFRLL
jgi:hypothetical protein